MKNKRTIALLGPESTGKTEISLWLSKSLQGVYYDEIARDYVANLGRPYQVSDLDTILSLQIDQYRKMQRSDGQLHVFDTEFIITKIWYEWVYGLTPVQFGSILTQMKFDLYLLCSPDLPWIPDPVRENGGENRIKLFEIYRKELEQYGYCYRIVIGTGTDRYFCALNHVLEVFPELRKEYDSKNFSRK